MRESNGCDGECLARGWLGEPRETRLPAHTQTGGKALSIRICLRWSPVTDQGDHPLDAVGKQFQCHLFC